MGGVRGVSQNRKIKKKMDSVKGRKSKMVNRGEIYYIQNTVAVGSEQTSNNRPAIIVSNSQNNRFSRVVEVVYLTTKEKNPLPTHVKIDSIDRPSTALCEQIHSVSTEEEMKAIDAALMVSLDLGIPKPEQCSNAEIERNIYKKLYEDIINKIVGRWQHEKIEQKKSASAGTDNGQSN